MRIFVAGGSGVLGRSVIPRLLASGRTVTATSRSTDTATSLQQPGVTPVVLDALDRAATFDALERARPDVVLHLMTDLGTGDSTSNARLRSVGTHNLVDASLATGVTRVVAQSISWVYPPGATVATEADPMDVDATGPRQTTISAVRELEAAVHQVGTGVVLRFGQLYGPGTWYAAAGRFGDDARAGRLPATGTVVSFVHVDDAASAIVAALDWPAGVWNVVDDEPVAGTEWAPAFAAAVGAPAPRVQDAADQGRPVSNRRLREQGFTLGHPTWRSGFAALAD